MNKSGLFIKNNVGRIILGSLIILTLAFIFTQSLLSKEASGDESAAVSDFISGFIPTSTPLGAFIFKNIRKIAHFVEFGVLGAEFALYALLYCRNKKKSLLFSVFASFIVAFLDESLQILSKRGSSVMDVWLDFFGALTFIFITVCVYLAAIYINKSRKG